MTYLEGVAAKIKANGIEVTCSVDAGDARHDIDRGIHRELTGLDALESVHDFAQHIPVGQGRVPIALACYLETLG